MCSRRHETFREVRRMGFEITLGSKHYRVLDPETGQQVGVLPRGQRAYDGHGRGGANLLASLRRHQRSERKPRPKRKPRP